MVSMQAEFLVYLAIMLPPAHQIACFVIAIQQPKNLGQIQQIKEFSAFYTLCILTRSQYL